MADDRPKIYVSLSAITDDQAVVIKVWEAIGRVALGLALDGIDVNTHISEFKDDDV